MDLEELLLGEGYMKVYPSDVVDFQTAYYPWLHFISDETQETDDAEVIGWCRSYDTRELFSGITHGTTCWSKRNRNRL